MREERLVYGCMGANRPEAQPFIDEARSMLDRYNIVSEDDLRMAAQKTTMYVDTLPVKRLP